MKVKVDGEEKEVTPRKLLEAALCVGAFVLVYGVVYALVRITMHGGL